LASIDTILAYDEIVEYGYLVGAILQDDRREENVGGSILVLPYVEPRRPAAYLRKQSSQAPTLPLKMLGKQNPEVFLTC